MSLVRAPAGSPEALLVSAYDITARKDADAALQDLKQHLQRYVEAERLHLAQDLHDVPLQELYGILYRLEEIRPKTSPDGEAVIGEVIADVKETLVSLRSIATGLRPPVILRSGFEEAARSYIQQFLEKHPAIVVRASLKPDRQMLAEDTRLMLFRILQESFSNILKHARATEVRVRFEFDTRQACLEITDNGQGFVVPDNWLGMARGGHYGLAGMAERVSMAGGVLQVTSVPGLSTTVRAVFPRSLVPAKAVSKTARPRKSGSR
jgi:two-component system NarL family sensor kinase